MKRFKFQFLNTRPEEEREGVGAIFTLIPDSPKRRRVLVCGPATMQYLRRTRGQEDDPQVGSCSCSLTARCKRSSSGSAGWVLHECLSWWGTGCESGRVFAVPSVRRGAVMSVSFLMVAGTPVSSV